MTKVRSEMEVEKRKGKERYNKRKHSAERRRIMGEIEVRSEALRPSADVKFSTNVLAPQPYNRGAGCEKSLSSAGYQEDGAL
jgi:hypothetical protein